MSEVAAAPKREKRKHWLLKERLWAVLLPGLFILSIAAATWDVFMLRQEIEDRETVALEQRLKSTASGLVPDLAHALDAGDLGRIETMLRTVANGVGGSSSLRASDGTILAQARRSASSGGEPLGASGGSRIEENDGSRRVLVWQPIRTRDGTLIAELRLRSQVGISRELPWKAFARTLSLLFLVSIGVMFLVSKLLSPLASLGAYLRELGRKGPRGKKFEACGFAEFGQLEQDLAACVADLETREQRLEESFVEIALNLAREYEGHREGGAGHGQRTRRYASWIAERLEMSPEERDSLELAALCHDIGREPVRADDPFSHYGDMESLHPIIGSAVFASMENFEEVAKIIRSHHENFDGSGFPDRLEGHRIPLGSRVLRIADAFDRLCHATLQDQTSVKSALAAMRAEVGLAYDPDLFSIFSEEISAHLLVKPHSWAQFLGATRLGASHN